MATQNAGPRPVKKPSYSNVDSPVGNVDLSQGDIKNMRMMHPDKVLQRKCLSTESAVNHQHHITQIPLGAKLPMVPGNQTTLVTTKLGQRLQKPSCDFDITTPKEIFVGNEYNDLHDPHLKQYFKKNPDLIQHLIDTNYIDKDGNVICTLDRYNDYRQYQKQLSIDSLNKKYREQYLHEKEENQTKKAKAIQQKIQDPANPINLKLRQAKQRRETRNAAEKNKRIANIEQQDENYNKRIAIRLKAEKHRALKRAQLEKDREKRKEVQLMRAAAERNKIEDQQLNKHYEDQKRMYEKSKRDRKIAQNRRKRLEEDFIRKEKYRLEKNNQLVLLAAEHELRRQQRVKQWESYFAAQLENQKLQLERIREERLREKLEAKRQRRLNLKQPANQSTSLETHSKTGDSSHERGSYVNRMFQFSSFRADSQTRNAQQQSSQQPREVNVQEVPCIVGLSEPDSESMASGWTDYSQASTTARQNMEAGFIVKQVIQTVEHGLPSLQNAIADFEMAHMRQMTDEEVYALIIS